MIELDSVFCVKYKPRKENGPIMYGIYIGEDDTFFYLNGAPHEMLNKKFYHYQRISGEEYLDAIQNQREVSRNERNS